MYFNGTSSPTSLLLFPVPVRVYLGVCVQEVFQQAFSLFLPKKFVKFERVRTFCSECTPEHLSAIHRQEENNGNSWQLFLSDTAMHKYIQS